MNNGDEGEDGGVRGWWFRFWGKPWVEGWFGVSGFVVLEERERVEREGGDEVDGHGERWWVEGAAFWVEGFSGSGWNVGAKKEEEERVKEGEGVLSGPVQQNRPVRFTGPVWFYYFSSYLNRFS